MKKLCFLLLLIPLIIACKDDVLTARVDEIAEGTPETASYGYGELQLSCGIQSLSIEGECSGTTTMGELIITVKDKIVPSRIFTISFNSNQFPKDGQMFTVKKSDYSNTEKKSKKDVYVGFSEVSPSHQMDWSSRDQSGKITFKVEGNEIKCRFKDIKLLPSEVYNKGDLNQTAVVSGEFNLYKNEYRLK